MPLNQLVNSNICCQHDDNLIAEEIPKDHPNHGARITMRRCRVCGVCHFRGSAGRETRIRVGADMSEMAVDPTYTTIVCAGAN